MVRRVVVKRHVGEDEFREDDGDDTHEYEANDAAPEEPVGQAEYICIFFDGATAKSIGKAEPPDEVEDGECNADPCFFMRGFEARVLFGLIGLW
ncbi:Uncharacterised protein [Lysinibacillus sphaericus]|nr:Uncharacterised protein [Lysinibacillus sphaericus]